MALQVKDASNVTKTTPVYAPTFSASKPAFVPAATAAELVVMQGGASTIARLKRILIYGSGGAASYTLFTAELRRWSSAGTLGTAVLTAIPTICKHSIQNGTPAVTISTVGTAAYTTPGTVSGVAWSGRTILPTTTYVAGEVLGPLFDVRFGEKGDNPPTVEGTADRLVLVATAVVATGILDITFEWDEDTV